MPKFDPADFKDPKPEFRPAPFWSWNDDLDEAELRRQIREMAAKGWGGYFMHSRVGLITPYLSEKWHSLVAACADEAGKTGTQAWLYDEDKWPSGFAGGIVPEENEKFRARALRVRQETAVDPSADRVLKKFEHEGTRYCVCAYTFPLGNAWFNGASYVDLLNPAVTDRFLEITIGGYKAKVGGHFGKEIPGIFTDEPGYVQQEWGRQDNLPWTDGLPDEFMKTHGYDLIERIDQLFFNTGDFRRLRHDFFGTATRLFIDNFSRRYFRKCEENGLIFTGHYMSEDSLESQVGWIGAAMPHYEFQHWPGIDKLGRHTEQTMTCKQVSSVADQLAKERCFCEVYGCSGQHFDFSGRRWVHHWEAALGVNFVNHHLSLYTMAGERKRDYPPNFFYQQPWWPYEKALSDHFGRLNYCLTRGVRDLDILVLHPIASAWATYEPLGRMTAGSNACSEYDMFLQRLTNRLLSSRLDFHFGDETIMAGHAKVENGSIVVGRQTYRTVVVPRSLTWSANTFDLLKKFHDNGGKLVFCGGTPRFSAMKDPRDCRAEFPKAEFFDSPDELSANLLGRKADVVRVTDADLDLPADTVFIHVRKLEDGTRLVFMTNTAEKKIVNSRVVLRFPGTVERIFCETGTIAGFGAQSEEDGTAFSHSFAGGGYLLLKVSRASRPEGVKRTVRVQSGKARSMILDKWTSRAADANSLVLDRIDLYKGEDRICRNTPVFRMWDNEFYKWPDGTSFRAVYGFEVETLPRGKVEAVVERGANLDYVFLNDRPLKISKSGTWLDPQFRRFDISRIVRQGENFLEIGGKKLNNITGPGTHRRVRADEFPFKPTELEAAFIVGDFQVSNRDNARFAIVRDGTFDPSVSDITMKGYPFYAGRFSFSSAVSLKEKPSSAVLELSGVRFPCVEVRVNGKKAGVLMWEPYSIDIGRHLKKGRNTIELVCPTDLFNLLGPNPEPLGLPAFTGPHSFRDTGDWSPRKFLLRRGIDYAILRLG